MLKLADNNCGDVVVAAQVITIVGCTGNGVIEFVKDKDVFYSN